MEIKKTDLCVNAEDLDVRGNGCTDDCTGGPYYNKPYKTLFPYTARYATYIRCGVPNAYVSYWY